MTRNHVDISGFVQSLQGEARQRIERAAIRATNQAAEHLLAEARELTPVSPTNPRHPHYLGTSGALRDSGTVQPAALRGDRVVAEVGFNATYAAAVHERLDANHQYPGAVNPRAQAKYLETAVTNNRVKVEQFVRNHVQRAMAAGGQ